MKWTMSRLSLIFGSLCEPNNRNASFTASFIQIADTKTYILKLSIRARLSVHIQLQQLLVAAIHYNKTAELHRR